MKINLKRNVLFSISSIFISLSLFSQELIEVASGKHHTLFLFEDGKILSFGENNYGQLGLGLTTDSNISPTYINSKQNFISISVGLKHSLAVAKDGALWGWGDNSRMQLGTNNQQKILSPQIINDSKDWVKVFAGGYESLALKKDGTLWKLRNFSQIKNPIDTKWKNVQLYCDEWGFEEYTLDVILEDEKGNFWTYGSSNKKSENSSLLNKFLSTKGQFYEILPIKEQYANTALQVNNFTYSYVYNNKLYIGGLSVLKKNKIKKLWNIIKDDYTGNKVFAYLSKNNTFENSTSIKQRITGLFSDYDTFCEDAYLNLFHYYAYTAILNNSGHLIIYTNGKKIISNEKIKIKNIFGGHNIFVQTEDDKIYGIGYFYPQKDFVTQNSFSYFFPISY